MTRASWPRLYAIVDVMVARHAGWNPVDLTKAYLEGGARLIQLRAPGEPAGAQLTLCQEMVRLASSANARVIVNDRSDLALMSGAAGVHVGQDDLPVSAVRKLLGPAAVVGLSTHDLDQVNAARSEAVSYVAIGPVFDTRTKETGYRAIGLEFVRRVAEAVGERPLVAIGGIRLETAASVISAGATSVAVIADLLSGGNPAQRVRCYLDVLGER